MNENVAVVRIFAAHWSRNFMYCLSMGRLLMMFRTSFWKRAILWRSSTLWNFWMISRLACSILILEDRSSATSRTNSYREWGRKSGLRFCQRCQCFWILRLTWSWSWSSWRCCWRVPSCPTGWLEGWGEGFPKKIAWKPCNNCAKKMFTFRVKIAWNFHIILYWCAKAILRKLWRKS